MANILAAANGNWSSTSTWIGGVLPTSADFVYANNRTITIDQNINVARLSTRGNNGATAGGGFTCTTTAGVVRTITSTIIEAGTTTCLTFNHAALNTLAYINFSGGSYGNNANLGSNINGITLTQSAVNTVYTSGPCYGVTGFNSAGMGVAGVVGSVHYHTGNVYGTTVATQSSGIMFAAGVTPAHTVYITGDLYGGTGGSGAGLYTPVTGTSTIYITGNIYGGNSANAPGLLVQNSFNYVITGNAIGSDIYSGPAISVTYAGGSPVVTLIGAAIGGRGLTDSNGFFTQQLVTAYIKRAKGSDAGVGIGGSSSNPGVLVSTQSADVRVEEFEFGARGVSPVRGFVKMTPGSNNVLVGRLSPTSSKTLIDSSTITSQLPATSNVRSGTSYNGGASTGTCVIPSASFVANGVAVDASVGTAILTQADVWNHVSPISSGSVGEKLKKTANTSDLIALG